MSEYSKEQSIRGILEEGSGSAFAKYRQLTTGDVGMLRFLGYEILTSTLGPLPGAVGLALRKLLWKRLFGTCGGGVIIGRGCVLRHPSKIRLGRGVVLDDGVVLDARGCPSGLEIGDGTIINRGAIVQSKGGDIRIGARVGIGAGSHLVSWTGLEIGDDSSIAGGCSLSAGTYSMADFLKPASEREPTSKGPIVIGKGVWLATRAVVLDAVRIGDEAVVSAGAVVSRKVPPRCIVQGDPAKVVFDFSER